MTIIFKTSSTSPQQLLCLSFKYLENILKPMFTNQYKPYNKPDHVSLSLKENQSHDKLRFPASNSIHLSLYHLISSESLSETP